MKEQDSVIEGTVSLEAQIKYVSSELKERVSNLFACKELKLITSKEIRLREKDIATYKGILESLTLLAAINSIKNLNDFQAAGEKNPVSINWVDQWIEENCITDPLLTSSFIDLYNDYLIWHKANRKGLPLTKFGLSKRLRARGFISKNVQGKFFYNLSLIKGAK